MEKIEDEFRRLRYRWRIAKAGDLNRTSNETFATLREATATGTAILNRILFPSDRKH